MTYHIAIDALLQTSVDKIVADQSKRALESLVHADVDLEEAVHDARKRFKKLRALARLVRPGLGKRYDEINQFYRDLGRVLSDVRDAEALKVTFNTKLAPKFDQELHADLRRDIEAWVENTRSRILSERSVETRVSQVRDKLNDAQGNLDLWRIDGKPDEILRKGLEATYRRGKNALSQAHRNPDDHHLHEWRKCVKYHRYHCRLLRDAWPKLMLSRVEDLDELSNALGDDHDLFVIVDRASEERGSQLSSQHLRLIENAARRQQREYREAAFLLGPKIYQEKPADHAARIIGYWKLARVQNL